MTPKSILLFINCLCLVSILFPIVRNFSIKDIFNSIFFFCILAVLTYGSAITNLILAIKTKTKTACIINTIAAFGFTAWFWNVHLGLSGAKDPQAPIVYAFITAKSLVVMIPLWIAWAFFNNTEKAKSMV